MIPVMTIGDYVVMFEALEEDRTARHHFIKECGWTEAQFKEIKRFPFFCAHVSLWLDGEKLADQYLGACSYKTEKDFYTTYAGDYFADMVRECFDEAGKALSMDIFEAAIKRLIPKESLTLPRID